MVCKIFRCSSKTKLVQSCFIATFKFKNLLFPDKQMNFITIIIQTYVWLGNINANFFFLSHQIYHYYHQMVFINLFYKKLFLQFSGFVDELLSTPKIIFWPNSLPKLHHPAPSNVIP